MIEQLGRMNRRAENLTASRVARREKNDEESGLLRTGNLVVIGASAGGPAALAQVLSGLPKDFPAAVVLVQHLDAEFVPGMASWLQGQSPLPVRVAREGDRPAAGTALISGGGRHLILTDTCTLGYTSNAGQSFFRPCIDLFFNSVAKHWKCRTVGVLLTGMGRDGARGLKALREAGAYTIAQDQATSAIYGMPKEAADIGAAIEILPLDRVADALMRVFGKERAS